MPKSKPALKGTASSNPNFRGFLNYSLNADDVAAVKRIEFSAEDVLSWLSKAVDSGFKLTFGYDNYNHCHQVIGTRSNPDHSDYGILLTGRGSTPEKALRQWFYIKDVIVGDDDWSAWLTPNRGLDIDD